MKLHYPDCKSVLGFVQGVLSLNITCIESKMETNVEQSASKFSKTFTTVICGVALLSDGYITSSIGVTQSLMKKQYGKEITGNSWAFKNMASYTFLGTIVGMAMFGYISDFIGRKAGMISANLLLIFFTICCAFTFSPDGSPEGLFTMFVVFRVGLGIGIGGEYPSSSVAASESSSEVSGNYRQALFIGVTNASIDAGWALAGFAAWMLALAFGNDLNKVELMWRLTIGLGVIVPATTLWFRAQLVEPEAYNKNKMVKIPYTLVIKKYWLRLAGISFIWFIYALCSYPFGLYAATITATVLPEDHTLSDQYFWDFVILLFYMPGAIGGAFLTNKIGPKYGMMIGLILQSVFAAILALNYETLSQRIEVFALMYGLFLTFGELGPGDNIGLVSSSSCATSVRGQFYAIAGVCGKIGAFFGTGYFPDVQKWFETGDTPLERTNNGNRGIFLLAAGLNIICAFVAYFTVIDMSQDIVAEENEEFKQYLRLNGIDVDEAFVPSESKIKV
ncbi:major facilitator superfamily domain-containing protein [Globomyces pollinis-pini]|nr:major facilitator superfamily domain-containing protein [Globomyces pollinis-pini]